jgi:2-keto-4-pentenoate hydratase/2-oxohepta-3-ene-1,7-dioic acid hydratase in catechol pathway
VRFARVKSGTGGNWRVTNRHGGWLPLDGFAGYEDTTRLADIAGLRQLNHLAELVERLADESADDVSLDLALDGVATIADREIDIWGVGLNYRGHAADLDAVQPSSGPGSYLRPTSCLIDNGEFIELPTQSARVTAEAELGLVIGVECKNVRRESWRSVVAGVTGVLDMTAEDAVRENPRYIPWSKGFDTFCSIGPVFVTLDEFGEGGLDCLRISTVRNGETIASATPADMKYDLGYLVEYFTAGRTFRPGTVICTGTPGAAVIKPGDSIQAVVEQVGTLTHTVR